MSQESSSRSSQPTPGAGSSPALQAPWRIEYLENLDADEKAGRKPALTAGASGSFLRDYWLDPAGDEPNHVIVRASHGLILLNAFPYTSGHLLAALGEARPTLMDYATDQRSQLWNLVDLAAALMEATLTPQGINIGVNQGRAAGAGVPQHLHVHLVPRWGGDVNFMSVIGQVRIIPASLEKMAARYRIAFEQMGGLAGWRSRTGAQV